MIQISQQDDTLNFVGYAALKMALIETTKHDTNNKLLDLQTAVFRGM